MTAHTKIPIFLKHTLSLIIKQLIPKKYKNILVRSLYIFTALYLLVFLKEFATQLYILLH